jgi:hypothetical protein
MTFADEIEQETEAIGRKIFRTSRGKASSPAEFCGTQLCIVQWASVF